MDEKKVRKVYTAVSTMTRTGTWVWGKIFQHGTSWVDVGHSPTAQHVRRYYLNDSVSIIASNRWHDDVANLESASDKEWLSKNTVILNVSEPLWEVQTA